MQINAGGTPTSQSVSKLWSELCNAAPTLLSARALSDDCRVVTAVWTQRDVISSSKRSIRANYVSLDNCSAYIALPSSESSTELYSPSGQKFVKFQEKKSESAAQILFAEVWNLDLGLQGQAGCNDATLEAVWKIDAKVHGSVYTDEWFGGVAWSPDETMFIYVAERPGFISAECDDKALPPDGDDIRENMKERNSSDPSEVWIDSLRSKYGAEMMSTLGEGYSKNRSPALFLADIKKGASCAMCAGYNKDQFPEIDDFYGEPQWSMDGKWVAVTRRPAALNEPSVENDCVADCPYMLGARYCYNRYSSVEMFPAPRSLEDGPKALSSLVALSNHRDLDDFCCYSPRFSPDSAILVYVSAPRKVFGRANSTVLPHGTSKVLRGVVLDKESSEPVASDPVTLVDVVYDSVPHAFPGLHMHALPGRPWLGCSSSDLICSSIWGSESRLLRIPIKKELCQGQLALQPVRPKEVKDISPAVGDTCTFSYSVHDVCASGVVLAVSSPVCPFRVAVLRLNGDRADFSFVSRLCSKSAMLSNVAMPFQCVDLVSTPSCGENVDGTSSARLFIESTDDVVRRFQATLMIPSFAERAHTRVPLIVYPHGGPHSSCVNSFSQGTAALLLMGMAVLYVNYRGSAGFPQNVLESLPGHVGYQDVTEVIQATRWALQDSKWLDKDRVGYVGGSHAGFLGAHVSVVQDTPFKRFALRNPVCNIASMVNVSDIPEWGFCEAGVAAVSSETGIALSADPAGLSKMWKVSPVSRIRKGGVAPGRTLIFVGGSDKRVPPEQSIEWQRLVTEAHGAGIVTLRWYEDSGHAIDEVPCGDDVWVHTIEFMQDM